MAKTFAESKQRKKLANPPLPALDFTYAPDLSYRAAAIYERTGRIPTIEEITEMDESWQADINLWMSWFEFYDVSE